MNEQLQSKLVEILTAMQEAAKAGGDFAMQQLPDIAQSYVLYGRIYTPLACIGIALVAIAIGLFARRFHKGSEGAVWVPAIVAWGFLGIVFSMQASACLMVWFAPKVWLLKEIAGLLK